MIDILIIAGGVALALGGLFVFALFLAKCIAFGMGDDE